MTGAASALGLSIPLQGSHDESSALPERKTSFDAGWSFTLGDIANAQSPQYTDGNWTKLNLPHD